MGPPRGDTWLCGAPLCQPSLLRSKCPVPSRPTFSHSRTRRCRPSESRECGPGVQAVLRALVSRWDGQAAPGRAQGGFGEQESPGGAQGCGADQHRGALCLNFLPRAEPISSGITCTVWGWDSLARHSTAQPRRQPHPGSSNHSKGQGEQGQGVPLGPAPASPQSSQHQRGWSRPRSHSPRGRLLLPPFLPRPNLPLCWPTSSVTSSPALQLTWSRAEPVTQVRCRGLQGWLGPAQHHVLIPALSLADINGFNMVAVTTARLSHPTATRPRIPGQRPPSIVLGSTGDPLGGEQPQGLPRAALCAPVPSMGQVPVPAWSTEGLDVLEGRSLALEDLKAEVRTLHILVDLMRVQHLRDLQDLRQELCQERTQRQALQVEIERVRKGLPC
ncbi:uncharacterized protein M8220_013819 isoform 1-T1 [Acridotheres tristis]